MFLVVIPVIYVLSEVSLCAGFISGHLLLGSMHFSSVSWIDTRFTQIAMNIQGTMSQIANTSLNSGNFHGGLDFISPVTRSICPEHDILPVYRASTSILAL